MIEIPHLKPQLLMDLEVDFGTTIANAIWQKIADHQNFVNQYVPIGMIMWFYGSIDYGSGPTPINLPNSTNWQFCDGTTITNANSPLVGYAMPDMRTLFLKHGTSVGSAGGSDSFTLYHDHGGVTGAASDAGGDVHTEGGTDGSHFNVHQHNIAADLAAAFSNLPPYIQLAPYMRIL